MTDDDDGILNMSNVSANSANTSGGAANVSQTAPVTPTFAGSLMPSTEEEGAVSDSVVVCLPVVDVEYGRYLLRFVDFFVKGYAL